MAKYIQSVDIVHADDDDCVALSSYLIECGKDEDNEAVLEDPKFGDIEGKKCKTCSGETSCPGHYGHIKLKYPIFHPLNMAVMSKLLLRICPECDHFDQQGDAMSGDDIDDEEEQFSIVNAVKKLCDICGGRLTDRIKFTQTKDDKKAKHGLERIGKKNLILSPENVKDLLDLNIDAVRKFLNDNSFVSERLVIGIIPVTPPCVRPSGSEKGVKVTDSVTVQYKYLMSRLYDLRDASPDAYRAGAFVRYKVLLGLTTSIDSSNRFLKQRLSGKDGYFRKFCLAKRVNYCCRSVISPDPKLCIDEIGIPIGFAKSMLVRSRQGELRDLKDGDLVLANRQPSLQRTSLLALRAKLMLRDNTIKLNPGIITPFNADFDGDEMSVYSVVNQESVSEVKRLCTIQVNLKGVGNSKINIGLSQDAMTGLHILSLEETKVDPMFISGRLLKRYRSTSGRMMISSLLPRDFDHTFDDVIIKNGILENGVVTKNNFWSGKGSIMSSYIAVYGADNSIKFLENIQNAVGQWIKSRGLSVTLRECSLPGTFSSPESGSIFDLTSHKFASEQAGLNSLRSGDGLLRMVTAGTKGDRNNIGQITASVGQQLVFGSKPKKKLMHIQDGVESEGFVTSSYFSGLKPHEMFYHSQMGREGVVRTGISTADTGYNQRMMVKFMEGITIKDDGSVRDSDDTIVQFGYGKDMSDPSKICGNNEPISLDYLQKEIDDL